EGGEVGRVVARVGEELRQAGIGQELLLLPAVDHVVEAEKAGVDAGEYLKLDVLRAVAQGVGVELAGDALGADAVEIRHGVPCVLDARQARNRSEEHTSELQSRFDLVCRLLLEK